MQNGYALGLNALVSATINSGSALAACVSELRHFIDPAQTIAQTKICHPE
jgi:hypothetical protein